MIEIVDDGIAINEYDNSDLLNLTDDDIVPPRPIRIHRSEYERVNKAIAQYRSTKNDAEPRATYDLSDVCESSSLSDVCESSSLAQSDPHDVVLIDFRELAASMHITYGEYKKKLARANKVMAEAFLKRGSLM